MCGIVAVSGTEHAAELAFLGLYALQHRGQEAAGIAAADGDGHVRLHKAAGLVSDSFDDARLRALPGRTALGHTRYSTAGGPGLVNAQPIVVSYRDGDLALVHNGNITNARTLRKQLIDEGAILQSTIDTEVIVHLIARSKEPTPELQIRDALAQLTGAYSLLITVGDTLYAARDPWGYRPLVLGRRDDGFVLASESCALDIMRADVSCEVPPGGLLRIRNGQVEELDPLPSRGDVAPCIFELVYFARPDSVIWSIGVDRARRAFGRQLAREHPIDADCVFSVPDSSNAAALGYSEESGIPLELGLIRNHYVGRTFIHPSQAGRDFRVRIKYNPVREVISGKRVVVVDDSLVRGTTSRALISMIRDAGATAVHFRVASPPVRFPCYYGIDMPTREELIGAQMSVEQIRARLDVDSLGYLSLDGMLDALDGYGPFCHACFSGDYKAPLVDIEAGLGADSHC